MGEPNMSRKNASRPAMQQLALAVSLGLFFTGAQHSAYAQMPSGSHDYQVQGGSLNQALNQVAQQAKVSLLIRSTQSGRYQVTELKGKYTVDQAFARLLQETPFQINKSAAGYVLLDKPNPVQAASTAAQGSAPLSGQGQAQIAKSEVTQVATQNQIYQMNTIHVQAQSEDTIQFGQSALDTTTINRYQANNVAQLLDTMPGVGAAGSPRPGGQTINILGMGGVADVPITLDDSIKTFDKYRQGSVFIEPEILKRVTVDKGPHNVEVGNGGFGGKVTLETKDAQDLLIDDHLVGGFLKYSRYSNNAQNTYTGAVYGKMDNGLADAMFYYTKRDSGNVERPDGSKFLYSAQEQDTYLSKLNFYPSAGHTISLKAMQSGHTGWEPFAAMRDQDASPLDRDIEKYGFEEAWKRRLVYRNQKDSSYTATYAYNPVDNPYINLDVVGSYSKTDQHDNRLPGVNGTAGLLGSESWVKYVNRAMKMTNISDIDTAYGSHKIKIGAQYQHMRQDSWLLDRSKTDPSKPANADVNFGYYQPYYMPAGTQTSLSAFVEDQYQIGAVTISPSLRYDYINNKGEENVAPRYNDPAAGHDYSAKSYQGWSPRLALAWQQADYLTWFGNISQTWRSPRLDELYSVQYANAAASATSRYLKPEKMLAIRLGNEMNFDDLFSEQDHLQVRLTYHHNRGKDEIFKNLSSFCQTQGEIRGQGGEADIDVCQGDYDKGWYRNVKDYTIKAYEAELFYNQPMWFAGLTYAYVRGERDQSPVNPWLGRKTWMTSIPPRKATATLGVTVPEHDLTMGWRGIFVDAQRRSLKDDDDSIAASSYSLPKTKGYALHSIYVDWKPIGAKGPQLNFSIDNLFNRDYKMYLGEYMTGTGRDYKLSISQSF
ncbi:hemoglobin/transferrin/lactoferrin receptor protein [Acinetobacter calcoaceticus]|uniref:Hemoglobin/transferrin/lactoferrin receptor protein n=1 Tax=Acinetobacter calcoaceticus TaxID=471 RepID=A0A4R1Y290_ACICA|nr:hemoglobin/transferrin/lactoferrin receptor protein [Acinetobacter calcoaceticus]